MDQGGLLRCLCECAAPGSEFVLVHAVAVVESLMHDRRMVGAVVAEVVDPGEARGFSLSVRIPADLSPGSYPCAVLAVVNGASYIARQMVEVLIAPMLVGTHAIT